MKVKEALKWFKETYPAELLTATKNTPYSPELLCAIAYQETGYIWGNLIGKVPLADIPLLCVGDTIDSPRRKAFPKNRQHLLSVPGGEAMFDIARNCLLEMAKHINGYESAVNNADKFCHGFGIFQYDLQHFVTNPDYFLQKKWANPDDCFAHCISELNDAGRRQGWASKTVLTDEEKVYVAIAYNKGTANLSKGFKQGFQSADGRFYGENVFDYLRLAQSLDNIVPGSPAPVPAPTPVLANNKIYRVKTTSGNLNLRSEPRIPKPNPESNRVTKLPNGHLLSWLSGAAGDKWFEVETSIAGAYFKGFVASEFLELVQDNTITIPVTQPAVSNPTAGIVAVSMPRSAGIITKRTTPANAFSLNEPGQQERKPDDDPAGLRNSIIAIIGWLDVEKLSHKRYQPANGNTFCNIYAHDFCHLAGVYFPRVWWTQSAIEKLVNNQSVEPLLNNTIEEIRVNNIFRWLRDFGGRFGWRQTGELNKLQNAVNTGAIGLIIARRIEEGRSGHVTMIVPETDNLKAKRDRDGNVIAPVQSQAGARNFKFSTGTLNWWLGPQFKEHAFLIHA